MSDDQKGAAQQEREMREHEREARERSGAESDAPAGAGKDGEPALGTNDEGGKPAPPGPAQGGNLGGAS